MDTRGLGGLVAFDGRRPPKLLDHIFWGTIAAYLAFVLAALLDGRTGGSVSAELLPLPLGAALAAAGLWPLLPWSPSASRRAKAATLLFLALTLVLFAFGHGVVAFFLVASAVGNAVAVLGRAGAVGYPAAAGALAFALHLGAPGQTLWGTLLETASVLLMCAVVVLAFAALDEARRGARETARLLEELRAAHAELRRRAERTRELTVAEERARMAREMHDSVGHCLTVINIGLANALRFRSPRPDDAWQEVREAQELTREALADTRRWVRALKPLQLEGRAGVAAMRALADSFSVAGIEVGFTVEGAEEAPELDEDTELVCYRALQEGYTNALRHSGAARVRGVLSLGGPAVTLSVRDDGRGAAPDAIENGFGLRGLRERVEAADGALTARSRPGGGFELCVSVPIRTAEPVADEAAGAAL